MILLLCNMTISYRLVLKGAGSLIFDVCHVYAINRYLPMSESWWYWNFVRKHAYNLYESCFKWKLIFWSVSYVDVKNGWWLYMRNLYDGKAGIIF